MDAGADASTDATGVPDAAATSAKIEDASADTSDAPDIAFTAPNEDAGGGDAQDLVAAGCVSGGQAYAVGETVPSIDGCNVCGCAADAQITCKPVPCKDGGTPACSLGHWYNFWYASNSLADDQVSSLSPPARFDLSSVGVIHDLNTLLREFELPCSEPAGAGVAEILKALADPDVVTALSANPAPFYGTDIRADGGAVFRFVRDDGHGFSVGSGDVPAGVRSLVDLLTGLQATASAMTDCQY